MIEARLPDGTALQFEDGTSDAVIDRTVKSHIQSAQPQRSASESAQQPPTMTNDVGQEMRLDETGAWVPVGPTPPGASMPTLEEARAAIQRGDMAALQYLKPAPDENAITSAAKKAAMVGVHGGATLLQFPINALLGLTQGPRIENGQISVPALTTNPQSGAPALTPEASATVSLAATPLQFGPRGPVPPSGTVNRLLGQDATVTGVRPINPAVVARAEGRDAFRGVQGEAPPATSQTGEFIPQPSQPPSTPQPTGAQVTPSSQSGLTAAEAADYGSAADKQWLYKSMVPGEVSDIEYIKGIKPTMAQREQTAVRARETKDLRNLSLEAAQAERELLAEHNDIRKRDFQETAGSDVTQGIKKRAADDAIDKELGAAFRAGGKVDAQPIVDAIEAELNSPSGKLPNVRAALKEVRDALNTRDGSALETNPQQVYGARRVINLLQSKEGRAERPTYASDDVQAALIRVKGVIDGAIEPAAPGFRQAIANYAEAQRALEANEILQTWEPKLYDSQGRMQFLPFHKMMNDAVKMRDPNVRPNPWQSLTEEQWNRLKSTHDDLMRVASAEDLAKAAGSDSIQNAAGLARRAVQAGAGNVAGVVAGMVVPPIASAPVGIVTKGFVDRLFSNSAQRRAQRDMNQMLRPDPTQYPTRPNPFMGPLEP